MPTALTELERAKSLGPDSHLIHLACHGLLDERFPRNSALALTLPGHPVESQDNGLLQAWEIFESMRLDADLVTLSACDTTLGKEMGGEGLVGLTRAFQYPVPSSERTRHPKVPKMRSQLLAPA